jgi:hypothetical protein
MRANAWKPLLEFIDSLCVIGTDLEVLGYASIGADLKVRGYAIRRAD